MILEHDSLQQEMQLQARTDPLTGLLNRRAFLDEVTRRIDRLERDTLPGTLMFIDLDHFKKLNDLAGHDTGDEALCAASGLLSRAVRPTDVVARLGGDEFAVWLDGADELAAAERAERLCEAAPRELAALGATLGVHLSMSIGIACRWPGGEDDMEALMRRADTAMYEVKRAGRGKWRVAKPRSDDDPPDDKGARRSR
jgi:diguanylate cyclase (GGDEF)-like protein